MAADPVAAPSTSADADDLLMCRVCRGNDGSLYYPCLCTGSIKYVHQECLVEWLKYSKKEVCELCNYKYSFQPIYRPDMPKSLPIFEIVRGMVMSLVDMLRTWMLYTFVMFAWLGLVPLTAARIYNCIFYVSFQEMFSLPIHLFRADHIIPDIIKGSMLLAIFICTFISLVWLREQIVLGGPQNFINIDEADDVEPRAEEGEEDAEDDSTDDEQNVYDEDEGEGDAMEDVGVGGEAREAQEQEQEQEDNWRDWDRFGEELTWQRLLGLDGSFVFLEHVFWVISLNTLFTFMFAYVPYRFGHGLLSLVNVQHRMHYFPSVADILCGYVVIASLVYMCHTLVGFLRLKSLYRVLGIAFLILKVFLLVLMEIGLFPIMCGCWIDVCTLPLFSVTLSQRIATFSASPCMSVFIHWMVGMVYVFYSASFVLLLREILRPGVLWFMRNLNDPEFNPIQEMIDQPFSRHLRRLVVSTTLFFTTILLIFYIPLLLIRRILPSVLPYNVSMSADTPLSELSLELLILQIVLPAVLEQAHGRVFLKVAVRQWCLHVGGLLSLDRYLLSDNRTMREAQPPVAAGGGLAAEHQALLLLREPQTFEPYIRPRFFALRIVVLLLAVAATTSLCSICVFVVPASVGRICIFIFTGQTNVHEIYSVGIGLYLCWLSGKVAFMGVVFFKRGIQHFKQTFLTYFSITARIVTACLPLVLLIPLLVGTYFQLVFLSPFRLSNNQSALYFPYQDWAMGVLQMKIFAVAVLMGPDWWLKQQLEQIHQQGFEQFDPISVLFKLVLPLFIYLSSCISVPYLLMTIYSVITGVDVEVSILILRFCYPTTLLLIIVVSFVKWQLFKFRQLAEKIKNEKYLVGTQLINYERD